MTPVWMVSATLETSVENARGWLHLPTDILHPWEVPDKLRLNYPCVFMQKGPPEPLVTAGVRAGVYLTVPQLKSLQCQLKFSLSTAGSGKNNRLVKQDYALGLIGFLFPNATQKEKDTMLMGILGKTALHLDPKKGNKHVPDILKAFRSLEPTDQKEYTELYAMANDELMLQEKRDGKARVQTLPKQPRKHLTPVALQDLCPPAVGCRLTRHPVLRRYQGFYPTYDDRGFLVGHALFV